jgi:uncharacterized protein YfiM (DUF2279 family)
MAAIAKEAYDMKQNGNHLYWKDIVADVAWHEYQAKQEEEMMQYINNE